LYGCWAGYKGLYKLGCYSFLALVNEGKISKVFANGTCVNRAYIGKTCLGGACVDKTCINKACVG
jgi:hypothetical protein